MNVLVQTDVQCPYCGEYYGTTVDTSQGAHETVEDCPVCCRPIQLIVDCDPGELFSVEVARS